MTSVREFFAAVSSRIALFIQFDMLYDRNDFQYENTQIICVPHINGKSDRRTNEYHHGNCDDQSDGEYGVKYGMNFQNDFCYRQNGINHIENQTDHSDNSTEYPKCERGMITTINRGHSEGRNKGCDHKSKADYTDCHTNHCGDFCPCAFHIIDSFLYLLVLRA